MFEKDAEEYRDGKACEVYHHIFGENAGSPADFAKRCFQDGAEFGYNRAKEELEKVNEWQTGEPIKGREIFARNIANCNLIATYFDGAWRNVWNGKIIDFDKISMWRYTGFKNNGEEIVLSKEIK